MTTENEIPLKFKFLDKEGNLPDESFQNLMVNERGNVFEVDDSMSTPDYIAHLFTGYLDSNGEEIYEGDILVDHVGGEYIADRHCYRWEDEGGGAEHWDEDFTRNEPFTRTNGQFYVHRGAPDPVNVQRKQALIDLLGETDGLKAWEAI